MRWAALVALGLLGSGFCTLATNEPQTLIRSEIQVGKLSEREPLLPSSSLLKLFTLGSGTTLADLLWLSTIQYFGGGNANINYPSLSSYLTRITQADPLFVAPYQFGLVVLPFMNQTDTALMLGERAQQTLPGNGLLTYYHATNYHLYKRDYRKAAELYQKSSTQVGAPSAAKTLAGVSLSQLADSRNDRIVALSFWQTVYDSAEAEEDKERAGNWIVHLSMVIQIEEANKQYKAKTGHYTTSQEVLQKAGLLETVYTSPLKRVLEINSETGTVGFEKVSEN
jgi:hypothetical protein